MTGGPHAQIMEAVKKVAAKSGLDIRIVEFSDYVQPNAALASGDLDANSYQHDPYLQAQVKDRGYKLVKVADTVTFPMGIYSKRVKSLAELKPGARLAVPNDPTNGGRALLLLQKQGLLKLRADAGLKATALDIVDNPRKLKIVELDAAQIPRSLGDVDAAAINTNYAMEAGLKPKQDAIAIEARTVRTRTSSRSARRTGTSRGSRTGRGLSFGRGEAVHRRQVRRRGHCRLVTGEARDARRD